MGKTEKSKEMETEGVDFEVAILETGFGKFNYLLLIIALPACLATTFETSTMSYILPSAECDLQLTLTDKGILNAITYCGMITSAVLWGFASDVLGRKKLLVYGFLLDALCMFCGSISQNKYALMTFKYLGGCIMNGPFAVLMTYVTEFHSAKYRARIMMCMGIYFSSGTLLLSLIAWGFLPHDWSVNVFNILVLHSWQIFLATCAIPSLLAGFTIILLPESPKFLMSQGRNAEALKIFQKLYSMNKGKPKEEYPIKSLINEKSNTKIIPNEKINGDLVKIENGDGDDQKIEKMSFQAGLAQIKPMFHKPHLGHSLHVYVIQFLILLGMNTFRLWLPQLFSSTADYEENFANSANATGSSSICEIIEYSVNKSEKNVASFMMDDYVCEAKISDSTFMNNVIVGISGLFGYLVAGVIINKLGNQIIMITGSAIAGLCAISLFWANNSIVVVAISATLVTTASICSTAILGIIVNLFPTTLRTMIVSISMMFGRLGAVIGNILFPYFMAMGCLPPFIMIGSVMLASSILCIFLPKTHKVPLQ